MRADEGSLNFKDLLYYLTPSKNLYAVWLESTLFPFLAEAVYND